MAPHHHHDDDTSFRHRYSSVERHVKRNGKLYGIGSTVGALVLGWAVWKACDGGWSKWQAIESNYRAIAQIQDDVQALKVQHTNDVIDLNTLRFQVNALLTTNANFQWWVRHTQVR